MKRFFGLIGNSVLLFGLSLFLVISIVADALVVGLIIAICFIGGVQLMFR